MNEKGIIIILVFILTLIIIYELLKFRTGDRKLLAILDKNTLLYNKKYFLERLENELKRSNRYGIPVALILVSLGDLGKIQKKKCEEINKKIAQSLRETLRETDILSKYSDNEFGIILPFERAEGTKVAIERIKSNLTKNKFLDNDSNQKLTMKFGLAVYPEDADSKNLLLKKVRDNAASSNSTLELS